MKYNFSMSRKVSAYSTYLSWKSIPHVTFLYEPDISPLLTYFNEIKKDFASKEKQEPTLNTLLLKIIALSLKENPLLYASFEYSPFYQNGKIKPCESVDLGIPWVFGDGSMVPLTIRNADGKSLAALSAEITDLKRRSANTDIEELLGRVAIRDTKQKLRSGDFSVWKRIFAVLIGKNTISRLKGKKRKAYYSIPAADRLTENDITSEALIVSNIGSLYKNLRGSFALLEIIAPKIMAIGISALQKKPVVYTNEGSEEIKTGTILPLCIAFDHRAMDFNDLIPFFKRFDELIENPGELL